jgi:UbiD family decarboxylase
MAIQDLREWMQRIDEIGELTRVDGADANLELGGLVDLYQWDMGNPALLFDNIVGYQPGYRVLANVLTSIPRVALSLGLPVEYTAHDLVMAWRSQLKDLKPLPRNVVPTGPIFENRFEGDAVDLSKIPAPLWHEADGGRYLGTGCLVVMRDPDNGWVNAGCYRVQFHDEHTAGIYISPGKQGRTMRDKYWARGEACPVAVCLGQDPLLLLLGGLEVESGTCEFDFAGAIRGEALDVVEAPFTGLPVPAAAEIVFEGLIPPNQLHDEGPFGEWTGYYAGGARSEPIIEVKTLMHRDHPIVVGCIPGKPPNDNTFFRSPMRAALIWDELERSGITGITGVWSHESGGGRMFTTVSITQLYPGHSKQVGMAAASCHAGAYANRFVVVVDDDIDPTDTNQVLWAMCTRTDVIEDVDVIKRCWSTPLDPMSYAGEGDRYFNNRMIIDACRPYDRLKTFPAVARTSDTYAKELRERWPELFTPDGRARKGVGQVDHTLTPTR